MWWDLNAFVKENGRLVLAQNIPTKKLKRDEIHQETRAMTKRGEGNGKTEEE